jgi:hypothetical protein
MFWDSSIKKAQDLWFSWISASMALTLAKLIPFVAPISFILALTALDSSTTQGMLPKGISK